MINLLLGVASPRDIPQVLNEHPLLPCDIYVVKYTGEWQAYFQIREFFLNHKEYTHLAIASDDVQVKPEHIKKIVKDLDKYDYEVLTGVMNVEQDDLEIVNITPLSNVPTPENDTRKYHWMTTSEIQGKGIIQVGFSGFPLMVIRRNIVQEIPFETDGPWNGTDHKSRGSLDVAFCWRCHEKGIKILCNTDVMLMHFRREGQSMVGTKQPTWYFRSKFSPDIISNWLTKKEMLRKRLDVFIQTGGLHNQAANEMMEAMADIILNS